MSYVRIPTGVMNVTSTVGRKSLLYYQCSKCHKMNLQPYEIAASGHASYHIFQSDGKKQGARDKAQSAAIDFLEKYDSLLAEDINIKHQYESINRKIICPHCKAVQPWSAIPKKWSKTKGFYVWLVGLIVIGFGLMTSLPIFIKSSPNAFLAITPSLFFVLILAVMPFIRMKRRKSAIESLKNDEYILPVYYNKDNVEDLQNSPAAELLNELSAQ